MIDSATQTKAIEILGDWLGNVLGSTARRVFAEHAVGPHEPTKVLTIAYTGDYGWSYPDWIANSGIGVKLAEIGLDIAPADGAIDAVMISETGPDSECRCKLCGYLSSDRIHTETFNCDGAY